MKRIAAIAVISLTISTCAVPASGNDVKLGPPQTTVPQESLVTWLESYAAERAAVEAKLQRMEELKSNSQKIQFAMDKVTKYVDKTWYVFSGSTPNGWDCSGLVRWTYQQIGVDLEHRASIQAKSGRIVESPKLGDLVIFKYKSSGRIHHSGIWLDENTMIHSGGRKGQRTEIEDIEAFAGDASSYYYVRILEN